MPMRRLSTALVLASALCVAASTASAEDGRYRIAVMQGGATPQVMLIDSREGHFWTWRQTIRGSDQELRYEGQLRPGKKPGETMQRTEVRRPAR